MTTPGSHGPGEQPPTGGSGWGPPTGSSAAGASQPGSVPPPPPPPGQYPPPQGQFPPPQGQFPPPQGQYGQGPGPGQGWAPQGQEKPKSSVGKWVGIAAAILALVVVGLLALAFLGGGDPEAGDCLQDDGGELSVVDCDDEAAAYRVVGVQEGEQTFDEYEADPNTCADFLEETTQSFWVGENGDETGEGVVYCVTDA